MRRRKKKGRIDHTRNRTEENKAFLNKSFKDLGEDLKDFDNKGQSVSSCSLVDNKKEESDEDLFQAAMKDVTPLEDNKNKVIKYPVEKESLPDLSLKLNKKEGEDFSSLVKELGAWDVSFSDEYMEGAVSGVGPKIMKRLKRGEFSVQDYIDLHGLTKKEAETVVDKFIIQSYHKGLRCVLIVHGRGLGSIDHKPAIKRELPVWFKRGILKKIVLAFVTAKPCDGGAGALYVLLKKR
jgi:DNA-nicking Smr family endonuclease